MAEDKVKILELDEGSLAELKAQGFIPVSIEGTTYKLAIASLLNKTTVTTIIDDRVMPSSFDGPIACKKTQGLKVQSCYLEDGQGRTLGYLIPMWNPSPDKKMFLYCQNNIMAWTEASDGSSDHKVSIDEDSVAGFLKDILVSDADEITLTPMNGTLRIGLNLTGESDPKLTTMPESEIDSNTNNYGAYGLQDGFEELEWGDNEFRSYSYCNAKIYQCMRISDAQGSITKCTIALAGSVLDWACLCIGVFDTRGNLLGHTGLRHVGKDFTSGTQLCSFDMRETSQGTLKIKRNTRYIVQVWSVGVQLAAKDRENANYLYDFDLRQNLESTLGNSVDFMDPINGSFNTAAKIPFISFGASDV